jgi:hypothetical protein
MCLTPAPRKQLSFLAVRLMSTRGSNQCPHLASKVCSRQSPLSAQAWKSDQPAHSQMPLVQVTHPTTRRSRHSMTFAHQDLALIRRSYVSLAPASQGPVQVTLLRRQSLRACTQLSTQAHPAHSWSQLFRLLSLPSRSRGEHPVRTRRGSAASAAYKTRQTIVSCPPRVFGHLFSCSSTYLLPSTGHER